jgi:hypothetical protein
MNPTPNPISKFTLIVAVLVLAVSAGALIPKSAYAAPGDLFATNNLGGSGHDGGCSIYQYTPSGPPPSTFGSFGCNFASNCGLAAPRGLAFDNNSPPNLFVATENFDGTNFQGRILKVASDGTPSTFTSAFPSNFFLQELAIDGAGDVFVSGSDVNTGVGTIYEVSPDGSTVTMFFGSSPSYPFHTNNTVGLAFDSAGNLFVAANVEQTVYKFLSTGGVLSSTPTTFVSGAPPFQSGEGPSALTFDASGNLFVSSIFTDSSGEILKFTPDGALYQPTPTGTPGVFATGLTNFPKGLAFDSAGNLFVAETGASGPGDILEFRAPGFSVSTFDDGSSPPNHFGPIGIGNRGPEWLAFAPGSNTSTPAGSNVTTNAGTVGFATIGLTFPSITTAGTTTVTPVNPSSAGYALGGSSLAYDITTTASYPIPAPIPPGIIVAFQVARPLDASQLTVFHNEGDNLVNVTCPNARPGPTPDTTTNTIYASVSSLSPFVVAKLPFTAQVQPPINADGTSVFSVKRGVVPVKFTLTQDGASTCTLPPATIALTRTAGGTIGSVNESTYIAQADSGSTFRIDSCQYVYNLNAGGLGVGTYRVDIKINGVPVGSAAFQVK